LGSFPLFLLILHWNTLFPKRAYSQRLSIARRLVLITLMKTNGDIQQISISGLVHSVWSSLLTTVDI